MKIFRQYEKAKVSLQSFSVLVLKESKEALLEEKKVDVLFDDISKGDTGKLEELEKYVTHLLKAILEKIKVQANAEMEQKLSLMREYIQTILNRNLHSFRTKKSTLYAEINY